MPYRNIIFDLDGTLTDSRRDIARAQLWVLERLGVSGFREEDLYRHIGKSLQQTFSLLLPPSMHDKIPDAARLYRDYYPRRSLLTTRLFPAVRETLEELNIRGKRLAVASTKRGPGIRRATDHFGITSLFVMLQGSEGMAFKPDPAILHRILSAQGWKPGESLMVGDTDLDILAGKKAGIATCAVTYGAQSAEELRVQAPDFVVNELSAILEIVG
jgi:phosphoglycolate phosphatase